MRRRMLIESEAAKLDKALMVRYDPRTTYLNITGTCRVLCGQGAAPIASQSPACRTVVSAYGGLQS